MRKNGESGQGRPAEPGRSLVQSVTRGLDLLEALAGHEELGLVDLAERAHLQPSTAHRLLGTLVERDFAARTRTGRYRLGNKLLHLADRAQQRTSRLRALARPHLEDICNANDETTNLAVLERKMAIYIEQVECSRSVRMFTELGRPVPAYAIGAGKAMLAFHADEDVANLVPDEPWERLTERTITTLDELREDLKKTRERGYAIDDEEYEDGVMCVAAPILDRAGVADAAISVSGPATRINRSDVHELGKRVARHATEVSLELGYVEQPPAPVGTSPAAP